MVMLRHVWVFLTLVLLNGYVPTLQFSRSQALGCVKSQSPLFVFNGGSTTSQVPEVTHELVNFNTSIPESALIDTSEHHTSSKRRRIRNILRMSKEQGSRREPAGQDEAAGVADNDTTSPVGDSATPVEGFWVKRLRLARDKGRRVKTDIRRLMGTRVRLFESASLNVTEIKRLNIRPVLVFINKKSGGQQGEALIQKLGEKLNRVQICDLSSHGPSEYLALYKALAADDECGGVQLLCCGGDGTAAWVLQEARMHDMRHVSVGVVPLGTGNDLNGVLVEAAQELLRRRPELVEDGARVITSADEVFARPEVLLDSLDVVYTHPNSNVCTGGVAAYAQASGLFTVDLDRWDVHIERRVEFDDDGITSVDAVGGATALTDTDGTDSGANMPAVPAQAPVVSDGVMGESDVEHFVVDASTFHMGSGDISSLSDASGVSIPGEGWWSNRILRGLGLETTVRRNNNINNNINNKTKKKKEKKKKKKKKAITRQMNNYMGIGCDGAVSMAFAELRRRYPGLFFHQIMNKLWYGLVGARTFFSFRQKDLSKCLKLAMDGVPLEIPEGTQGIIVLNINSYAGGTTMWRFGGRPKPAELSKPSLDGPMNPFDALRRCEWRESSMSDGIIEIVAVSSVAHLGQISAGLASARPLAQGSVLEVASDCSLPMQIDGEPFMQRASRVRVGLGCRATMRLPITTVPEENSGMLQGVSTDDDVMHQAWCMNYS